MLREHARDVERHVAVADDGDRLRLERPLAREVGVAVVPADEVGGAVAAGQVDAGDVEGGVPDRAGREDHGVVVLLEVVEGDVAAEEHVAEEADVAAVEHVAQGGDDALDARVVGRDAVAHEPVGGGQLLEQVDRDVELLLGLEQDVGGVDAGGAGADDGETELVRSSCAPRVGVSARAQLERSTIVSAKRVRAFLTGPSGSGGERGDRLAPPSGAPRRGSPAVTACSRSSAIGGRECGLVGSPSTADDVALDAAQQVGGVGSVSATSAQVQQRQRRDAGAQVGARGLAGRPRSRATGR